MLKLKHIDQYILHLFSMYKYLKIIALLPFFFFILTKSYTQAGLQVYTGVSQAINNSVSITPNGTTHQGYHLGADARLNSGNMYFVIGGQFHTIEFLAVSDGSFFSVTEKMNWGKLRAGLGFNVINFIEEKIALRAKVLGSINSFLKIPEVSSAPFQNYNSGTASAVVGVGCDLLAFTLDIEYEKGFFNAVNMVQGTQFDFWTVSVGVRF